MNISRYIDERELIQAALAGSRTAYDALYRRYASRLLHQILGIAGCPEDAEECVQDAFVQAYIKLDSFRGGSSFYTWLSRIAINRALSHRRRRRSDVLQLSGLKWLPSSLIDQANAPSEPMLRQERFHIVRSALSRLPEDFQAILELREWQQYDYGTIADTLGIGVGTVRSRLHRARIALRQQLLASGMEAEAG